MITPAALDRLFAGYLATAARTAPSETALAALIATLPFPTQRRAARLYARGFVRGCDYCHAAARQGFDRDLAAIETEVRAVLASIEALRRASPESPP